VVWRRAGLSFRPDPQDLDTVGSLRFGLAPQDLPTRIDAAEVRREG
jgi:hypothetical protein